MGKKQQNKDEAPNPNSVVNREIFQRLNFLYQASAYLKTLEAPGSERKKGGKRKATLGDLGRSYVRNMRTIGNKSVVRIDPNVKRSLCKGCDTVLAPGSTASVRVKGSRAMGHEVAYTCLACHTSRIIPAPPVATAPANTPPAPSTLPQDTPAPARPRARKRKAPVPRPLPLFARPDAGHVVFRGNDMLVDAQEE